MNAVPAISVFVGLGSNLAGPADQVRKAMERLDEIANTRLLKHSPLYLSEPLGPAGQAHYVNAVALLRTESGPEALLDALQAIESAHGRVRGERWGPRTLDLDILLYGTRVIDTPRLRVPHPEMLSRDFVLLPLFDLAPQLQIPGQGSLAHYVRLLKDRSARLLASP